MATPKGKGKSVSGRRKATAHERAVLKAAKARGLTGIDLRKPLSRYARDLVKKFEPVYSQEASVVKVPRSGRAKLKGVTYAAGKAIIPKRTIDEVARYDKKSGKIVVTDSKRKTRRTVGRKISERTRTVITFNPGTSRRVKRTYSGTGAGSQAARFLSEYDPDIVDDADISFEYYDDVDNEWHKFADDDADWRDMLDLDEDEDF